MTLLEDVREGGYSEEPEIAEQDIKAWRESMEQALVGASRRWPGAPTSMDGEDASRLVELLEEQLREIDLLLRQRYGMPHHHNVSDPLAELLLIILSRKTPEVAYLRAFERLLDSVNSWDEIEGMDEDDLLDMVEDGGLGGKKVVAIQEMLRLVGAKDDAYSMAFVHDLDDAELKSFLMSVPEVGPKSALCVMMYALERAAFPVDAHVGRTLMRMGVFELIGLDLAKLDHKQKQRYLEKLVPPDLRYSLHVLGLSLGRDICGAGTPDCASCPLPELCKTGAEALAAEDLE